MKIITRTTTATTEKGNQMILTVIAKRGYEDVTEKVWIDEYVNKTSTKEINETSVSIEVNGQVFNGLFRLLDADEVRKYNNSLYASFANKLGVSKTIYNQFAQVIVEAKKEAEKDENWMKLQAIKEQNRKEEEEYNKHYDAVENMMTLNGKTY